MAPRKGVGPIHEGPSKKQQETKRDDQPSKGPGRPVDAKDAKSEPAKGKVDPNQAAKDQPIESADEAITRFTGYLVIIGGLQLFAMAIQAYYMYRTIKETRDAVRATERAYLKLGDEVGPLVAGKPVDMKSHVTNTGRTAAKNIRMGINVYMEQSSPIPDVAPKIETKVNGSFLNLAPDETFRNFITTPPMTAENIEAIQSGKYTMFYMARIEYEDAFGSKHAIGYARRYEPSMNPPIMIAVGGESYNYAD